MNKLTQSKYNLIDDELFNTNTEPETQSYKSIKHSRSKLFALFERYMLILNSL